MLKILSKNKIFLILYLIFFIASIIILINFNKEEVHLFSNNYHNIFFDTFFKYITHLGDGYFAVLLVSIFLFINYKKALLIALSTGISGAITQFIKLYFFHGSARPDKIFRELNIDLHLIDGVDINQINSFPSGHTTCAFSIFFCFALFSKNKYLKAIFIAIAILIGYSRVYLSQHFLMDIVAGSFIGLFITLICYWIINDKKWNWLNKSLLKK